jgi:hypothetical protein
MRRRRWWLGLLAFVVAIGASSLAGAAQVEGGKIVLLGAGTGSVRYVAQPVGFEGVCPPTCGFRSRIPLDKPILTINRDWLAFRDARGTGPQRDGSLGKVQPGLALAVAGDLRGASIRSGERSLRLRGLRARFDENSWDGLVEDSAKPAVSGAFATIELTLRVPAGAC